MRLGPREKMAKLAKELAEQRGGDIFWAQGNGGTNTIYVSSVLFRDIEANMLRQGKVGFGMPSLCPAGASMDKENSLLRAVLWRSCGIRGGLCRASLVCGKER